MICIVDGQEFIGRTGAKFCSDKCRKAWSRNKSDKKLENKSDKIKSDTEMTVTDKLFAEDALARGLGEYYMFDTTIYDRKCVECRKKYKTSLSLLKFCSPACRDSVLR